MNPYCDHFDAIFDDSSDFFTGFAEGADVTAAEIVRALGYTPASETALAAVVAAVGALEENKADKTALEAKADKSELDEVNNQLSKSLIEIDKKVDDIQNIIYSVNSPNLITSDNIRDGVDTSSVKVVVDKEKLTIDVKYSTQASSDTSIITLRTKPISLDIGARYYAFVHVKGHDDNSIPSGKISLHFTTDGGTTDYIAIDYLSCVRDFDGYIFGEYVPTKSSGFLRFAFNGMGTANKTVHFAVDKIVLCKINADTDLNAIKNFLMNAENPIKSILVPKQETTKDADILAWGDSLTAGAGGSGTTWLNVCASELGLSALNCGVGGETANTIACRQGGNNVIIPAGSINGAYETLHDIFGGTIAPLLQGNGNGSGNKLIIDGYECELSYSNGKYTVSGYNGNPTTIPVIARFKGSEFTGDIVTIWAGTNGATFHGNSTEVDARIAIIKSMINHIGHDRYVVLGLSVGEENASFYQNEENKMWNAFGNKYFNTRKMLVDNGLTLSGITPTLQDEADLSTGRVPSSLRSDATHLNASGYTALGKMMATKIRSLGYV